MYNYFLIGAGGFIGAIARYLVSAFIGQKWGRSFPVGTLAVNVSGSFLIGLLMTLFMGRFVASPQVRLFLIVGFLGSYTTFSTFEYETGSLLADGEMVLASLNIILSVVAGFLALKIGELMANAL